MTYLYYVDLVNGNDSNSGTSPTSPVKTLEQALTLPNPLAPQPSEIWVTSTPDPTSIGSATWTNNSATVTLASPLTKTLSSCDSGWSAGSGPSVTISYNNSDYMEGSQSLSVDTDIMGFSNASFQQAAYITISSTNYSTYGQVMFWLKHNYNGSSVPGAGVIPSGNIKLSLCSDTLGATSVYDMVINQNLSANVWIPIVVDLGATFTSATAIQSIALYFTSAGMTGGNTSVILFDNMEACLPSANSSALTLLSLISKRSTHPNSNTGGHEETFYALKSISGTNVVLKGTANSIDSLYDGYPGTTATVTSYKIETCKPPGFLVSPHAFTVANFPDLTISGGFNSTFTANSGCTWFDGTCGISTAFIITSSVFTLLNVGLVRFYDGVYCNSTGGTIYNISCNGVTCNNNYSRGINQQAYTYYTGSMGLKSLTGNAIGIQIAVNVLSTPLGSSNGFFIDNCSCNSSYGSNFASTYLQIGKLYARNNNAYDVAVICNKGELDELDLGGGTSSDGLALTCYGDLEINGFSSVGHTNGINLLDLRKPLIIRDMTSSNINGINFYTSYGMEVIVDNLNSTDTTFANFNTDYLCGQAVKVQNIGGVAGTAMTYLPSSRSIVLDTADAPSGSSVDWKINIPSWESIVTNFYPVMKVPGIFFNAGTLVTFTCQVKSNAYFDLQLRGSSVYGGTGGVVATTSVTSTGGSYVTTTMTFTPLVAGALDLLVMTSKYSNPSPTTIQLANFTLSQG